MNNFVSVARRDLSCITISNVIHFYNYLERYDSDLQRYILCFACDKFEDLIKMPEFPFIPLKKLCSLLSSDNLRANTELSVFQAAAQWLNYDYKKRQAFCQPILACVRFTLIPPLDLLVHVYHPQRHLFREAQSVDLIVSRFECLTPFATTIFRAMAFHAIKEGVPFNEGGDIASSTIGPATLPFKCEVLLPREKDRAPVLFIPDLGVSQRYCNHDGVSSPHKLHNLIASLPMMAKSGQTVTQCGIEPIQSEFIKTIDLWCETSTNLDKNIKNTGDRKIIKSSVKYATLEDPTFVTDIKLQRKKASENPNNTTQGVIQNKQENIDRKGQNLEFTSKIKY